MPTEFEKELAVKVFCIEMIEKYMTHENPIEILETTIHSAFVESPTYDLDTLPVENIAKTMLMTISNSIIECHELTSLATFYETKKISHEMLNISDQISDIHSLLFRYPDLPSAGITINISLTTGDTLIKDNKTILPLRDVPAWSANDAILQAE